MSKEAIRPWAEGELPLAYVPFKNLDLCSNKLVDVKIAIDIGGIPLLLVGVGTRCPLVWLSAPVAPDNRSRRYLVEGYASFIQALRVSLNERRGTTELHLGERMLLNVSQVNPTTARVTAIDLQPLGLQVVGNKGELKIGGGSMRGNNISHSQVAIGLA